MSALCCCAPNDIDLIRLQFIVARLMRVYVKGAHLFEASKELIML